MDGFDFLYRIVRWPEDGKAPVDVACCASYGLVDVCWEQATKEWPDSHLTMQQRTRTIRSTR